MCDIKKGKGLWSLIQDQEPIICQPATKLDLNEMVKELQKQSAPKEHTLYVGGLTNKFMTAYATDNKELLAEANAELKVIQDNLYARLSNLTKESFDDIKTLCKKYHHKHHLGLLNPANWFLSVILS